MEIWIAAVAAVIALIAMIWQIRAWRIDRAERDQQATVEKVDGERRVADAFLHWLEGRRVIMIRAM